MKLFLLPHTFNTKSRWGSESAEIESSSASLDSSASPQISSRGRRSGPANVAKGSLERPQYLLYPYRDMYMILSLHFQIFPGVSLQRPLCQKQKPGWVLSPQVLAPLLEIAFQPWRENSEKR